MVPVFILFLAVSFKNTVSITVFTVYNAHPYFEACFQKKVFQRHSCRKIIFWKNSTEMSNLALHAQKSVTEVDANHLMFCLFSDTSSFMMFSFSSVVLLLHD